MAQSRRKRTTRPIIFVFCEGKTEEEYVKLLKSYFRVPSIIVTKEVGTKISQRLVDTFVKSNGYVGRDKVFLFYDGDRSDILKNLKEIRNAELLLSVPCIELWFLLHFTHYRREGNAKNVLQELRRFVSDYEKGCITEKFQKVLRENWREASERAHQLFEGENPSTNAYVLPEYLERQK